jgi:hypothetical protein
VVIANPTLVGWGTGTVNDDVVPVALTLPVESEAITLNVYAAGGGDTNVTERADPGCAGAAVTLGDEDTVYVIFVPVTAGHETLTSVANKTAAGAGVVRTVPVVVTDGPTNAVVLEGVRVNR